MKLIILHHHLRPGGVRRIIELATPHLVRAAQGRLTAITLASGEAPDEAWRTQFARSLGDRTAEIFVEPAFGYLSEQSGPPAKLRRRIRAALAQLLAGDGQKVVVWAHNLGLARNLILAQELARACEATGATLLAHHHDWWFDNRWPRWAEARRAGFRSLGVIARAIFGPTQTQQLTINRADAAVLRRHLGGKVSWLPNLTAPAPPPDRGRQRAAEDWLRDRLGTDAPVWLLPCRLLRRKNVAEALLLTRWLRPEAWLVTTGGASSADEQVYHDRLAAAARSHSWQVRLGVLAGDESRKPAVAELLAASEAVLLTSIQEGFGLPYLEASAARRPLVARNLPNIAPDLAKFGFVFPQNYDELQVATSLFDWPAEQQRQQRLFAHWKKALPRSCQSWVGQPMVLACDREPKSVPFSRLTLTAQLEVLAQPVVRSWDLCAPLNPLLHGWRDRAAAGKLRVTPWPRRAERWLSGEAYARRLVALLNPRRKRVIRRTELVAQAEFIRLKLASRHLHPLLWSRDT